MMERMKGEKSFWAAYFEIVNFTDLPFMWEDAEIKAF